MSLRIRKEDLDKIINQSAFIKNGDGNEQSYAELVLGNFPRCEEFWKGFVVPITRRIEIPDGKLEDIIRFRVGVDPQLMSIASIHYSIFMHLVYAHEHFKMQTPSMIEDIYAHLATVCDLAETLIENWHLLLLKCQGQPSNIIQALSRDDFLEIAGKWYDDNYAQSYEYYYSKGKFKSIVLQGGKNLVHEYYGDSEARKNYARFSNNIRAFRNAVVHDVKLALLINSEGNALIPKLDKISNYRTWKAVHDVAIEPKVIKRDFIEIDVHVEASIQGLEVRLNDLWEKLIQDGTDEFNSIERVSFRSLFGIEISDTPGYYIIGTTLTDSSEDMRYYPYSGMYPRMDMLRYQSTSGSAGFTIEEDGNPS